MRYWVFTSKPGHFDMSKALIPGQILDWPTFSRFKFEVGDLVFIYASSPVLQMIGKLVIEQTSLPFCEADPRNDLRKWPKKHSSIPWLRMRVLQCAPVPFKPLQRGSLYYYTQFKPSPYPKLLHEGEIDYVLRAFDKAMEFTSDSLRGEGKFSSRVINGRPDAEVLAETLASLVSGHISAMKYERELRKITVSATNKEGATVNLKFDGVRRINWFAENDNDAIDHVQVSEEGIYVLTHFHGADLEILSEDINIG